MKRHTKDVLATIEIIIRIKCLYNIYLALIFIFNLKKNYLFIYLFIL